MINHPNGLSMPLVEIDQEAKEVKAFGWSCSDNSELLAGGNECIPYSRPFASSLLLDSPEIRNRTPILSFT